MGAKGLAAALAVFVLSHAAVAEQSQGVTLAGEKMLWTIEGVAIGAGLQFLRSSTALFDDTLTDNINPPARSNVLPTIHRGHCSNKPDGPTINRANLPIFRGVAATIKTMDAQITTWPWLLEQLDEDRLAMHRSEEEQCTTVHFDFTVPKQLKCLSWRFWRYGTLGQLRRALVYLTELRLQDPKLHRDLFVEWLSFGLHRIYTLLRKVVWYSDTTCGDKISKNDEFDDLVIWHLEAIANKKSVDVHREFSVMSKHGTSEAVRAISSVDEEWFKWPLCRQFDESKKYLEEQATKYGDQTALMLAGWMDKVDPKTNAIHDTIISQLVADSSDLDQVRKCLLLPVGLLRADEEET